MRRADLPCERSVRVALAGIERCEVLFDGHEIAADHRAGERERGADAERVDHRRLHQRARTRRRARRTRSRAARPVRAAQRGGSRRRPPRRDTATAGCREVRTAAFRTRRAARRSADPRRPQPTSRAGARARWSRSERIAAGCIAPTRTSGRSVWRSANASRPRDPARWSTSAPGSSDDAKLPRRRLDGPVGCRDDHDRGTLAGVGDERRPRREARHGRGGRDRIGRAPRDRNDLPTPLDQRQRDRGPGAPGADECERLGSRRLGCFHARSVEGTGRVTRPVETPRLPPLRERLPMSHRRRPGRARRHEAARARTRAPTSAGAES